MDINKTIRNLLIVVALLLVAHLLVATLKPQVVKPKIVVSPHGEIFRMWPGGAVDEFDRGERRWVSQEQRITDLEKARADRLIAEAAAAEQKIADLEEAEQRKADELVRYKKSLLYRDEFIEKKEQGAEPNIVEQQVFEGALRYIQDYEIHRDLVGQSTPRLPGVTE